MESDGTIQSTIHSKGIIRVLSVADLNMDRSLEIIGASRNVVYVFDMIGNRVWEYSDFGSPP